jgi:hypothetical protein
MKSEPLTYSLIGGGLVAFAWAVSTLPISIGVAAAVGYASVAAILAMLVNEYRVTARKLNLK